MIADSNNSTLQRDHVVFIHGLAAHRMLLMPMAWQIRRLGFTTSTFGYPSCWWSIEHHAKRFAARLQQLENDDSVNSFHIVGHSMGGIVTRQTLLNNRYEKLSRIVMLGSPNHGSPVARALSTVLPFCKTLRQVSSHSESFVNRLPIPAGAEIGIIAAKHDRVIPALSSHLDNEVDHITIFSGHNGLLVRPTAIRQIGEFLQNGRFNRERV